MGMVPYNVIYGGVRQPLGRAMYYERRESAIASVEHLRRGERYR